MQARLVYALGYSKHQQNSFKILVLNMLSLRQLVCLASGKGARMLRRRCRVRSADDAKHMRRRRLPGHSRDIRCSCANMIHYDAS